MEHEESNQPNQWISIQRGKSIQHIMCWISTFFHRKTYYPGGPLLPVIRWAHNSTAIGVGYNRPVIHFFKAIFRGPITPFEQLVGENLPCLNNGYLDFSALPWNRNVGKPRKIRTETSRSDIYLHHLNGIIERDWIDFETTKGFGNVWGMNWSYFEIIKYII